MAHGGAERSLTLKDDDDPGKGHFASITCWLVIFQKGLTITNQ